jgi:deazaflavin-dependent oxidoreductase (nitroreductase family)
MFNNAIQAALAQDLTIDVTTMGRKSGEPRQIEIWFHRINGRYYITGTPGPRAWYANLVANPAFTFHLKETTQADLPAHARPITDPDERRQILTDPALSWYHEQVKIIDNFVNNAPLVEVIFT